MTRARENSHVTPHRSQRTTDTQTLATAEADANQRLDVFLAGKLSDLSRANIQSLIKSGRVLLNGTPSRASARLATGDIIVVEVILPPSLTASPEQIALNVVYEDQDLAVIDKPAGLVVHPAAGHESGTLANALVARYPQLQPQSNELRPGIVHRLDKDTSGLMVVALNPYAQKSLQEQLASRQMTRKYLALATGNVEPHEGVIEAPIGRDRRDPKRMATHGAASRDAVTEYRALQQFPGFTLVEASLRTGRTHQIRVHFKAIGHPIAGDRTYHGASIPELDRQFLHAYRLALRSPSTDEVLQIESPLPADLQRVLVSIEHLEGGRII